MVDDRRRHAKRAGDEQEEQVEASHAASAEAAVEPKTPVTQQIGRGVVAVVVILFLIFAVANSQRVTFNWIFGQTVAVDTPEGVVGGIPLILLLLTAFLFGMVVGAGLLWRSRRVRQTPVGAGRGGRADRRARASRQR